MNVGSPDHPEKKSVRRFLKQFLNDKRVIDLPWILRKLLVNLIIIPFRVNKSTQLYKRLFDKKGSPLIYHTVELKEKLQNYLGDKFHVFIGMRYGNPGYTETLTEIKKLGFQQIVLVPLYPQYAMSTTETAIIAIKDEIKRQKIDSELIIIQQFYNDPGFIKAFAEQAKKHQPDKFDHVIFSYHGLPDRHIEKSHPGIKTETCQCPLSFPKHGRNCYRATSYETSRLIAKELELKSNNYTVAFQSRLSKNWLSPFTDEIIMQMVQMGKKNLLILAPSFVTDCLETLIEIEEDYKKMFMENGGHKLELIESLNVNKIWVETLSNMIINTTKTNTN